MKIDLLQFIDRLPIRLAWILFFFSFVNVYGQAAGRISLEAIQQRYAGKWPSTMSYSKKVAIKRYGLEDSTIHYHAYIFPKYGRIDQGSLDDGNGILIHDDIDYIFRKYKQNSQGKRNWYFSDYMLGRIYFDDIAGMKEVLIRSKIDYNMQTKGMWDGRSVYVIGATSLDDRYHNQVWYDVEQLYPVRFIDGLSGNVYDTQYRIKKYGAVWFPESAIEFINKRQTGTVSYLDLSFERKLPEELFALDRFGSYHWMQN